MKSQGSYWNEFILDWDSSVYQSRADGMGLVERLATQFRSVLVYRMNVAIDAMREYVDGRTVLEIGCGTGRFSRALLHHGAAKVTGVDISSLAIEKANEDCQQEEIARDRYDFMCLDLKDLPSVAVSPDVVTGLGILQYLTDDEFRDVFRCFPTSTVFFEFHERKWSTLEVCHSIYRFLKPTLPFYQRRSRQELKALLEESGHTNIRYYRTRGVSFFTNIPNCGDWQPL